MTQVLQRLFEQWAGEPCDECLALGANGSSRRYYRLRGATRQCIGTVGDEVRENEAFVAYARHLSAKGMPVPEVYAVSDDHLRYLQQDLGDRTLYSLLHDKRRQGGGVDPEMLALYRQVLTDLAAIQQAGADMDFSMAYPRPAFDRQSILWDLNYFKYFFLKLAHVAFDEQRLEDDFRRLADYLMEADCGYFLYRDFQGRNIMVVDLGVESGKWKVERGTPHSSLLTPHSQPTHRPTVSQALYYIDFQGGRRGAAQYDVASLLYSAKSALPEPVRIELLSHYLSVRGLKGEARRMWLDQFWAYLLVRILQTLGAYGYRGLYEKKPYFIESIPPALNNLRNLLDSHPLPIDLPELGAVCRRVVENGEWRTESGERNSSLLTPHSSLPTDPQTHRLTDSFLSVTVLSFSFKQGLPDDPSGNGGGFIFDCRALPNPGRYDEYKAYTGKDRPVAEFLRREPAVGRFLEHTQALVAQSVDKYLERRFTHLQVAFGCTGGQHRSVYCAEQTARWLQSVYPDCRVLLQHREQDGVSL